MADTSQNWMTKGQLKEPFFAYINFNVTHESQIRVPRPKYEANTTRLKPTERRDPAKVTLPPYYPDAPEVRKDIATYHENVTAVDYQVGDVLKWLDEKKLADNTVVFFFGDHGWGMSRGKRWLYDSGLRAPLLVRWPGTIKPGTVREDLVAFVDFAPTVLSIAGVKPPERMQGRVFLGDQPTQRKYVFAARDRMDETFDRIRAVRDRRYKYLRNYYPELPYAQHILYMNEMPTMRVWRKHAADGKLTGPQALFFAPTKSREELYDCEIDPHEVHNLAADPAHADKLRELSGVLDQWVKDTKDLGAVPETELIRRGLVEDRISKEYADRIKQHPPGSKASTLPPTR
jgi:N-sulfoglucosamine sulfohydrolase